ncbi:MAG: sulfatase-like hydrolase/transferase, partial [Pirellulales bacterium]
MRLLLRMCCLLLGMSNLLAAGLASADTSEAAERPNIVWIFAEDMNDWYGCYGHDVVETPHVDGLAERGVRFTRAYMPAGVCSATRSAIALGAMQTTYGVHNHRSSRRRVPGEVNHLPEGVKTVYEHLREGGYYVVSQGMNKDDFNFPFEANKLYDSHNYRGDFAQPAWRDRAEGQPFFAQV